MSQSSGGGTMPRLEPSGVGRTFLVGGSLVAGTLAGTWLLMLNHKKREQAAGRNPYHEQLKHHMSRGTLHVPADEELRPMPSKYGEVPPAFVRNEHSSGHMTNKSPGFTRERRFEQPAPQRPQHDNPLKAYTKAPDYVHNYGKTEKARQVLLHPQPAAA